MCRNITELRGLEPPATAEEIEAAARQYVRKVSGLTRPSSANTEAFEAGGGRSRGDDDAAAARTCRTRRQPPKTDPPLRRLARQ